MTKVFIGGSRKISRLNLAIRERVDNIVSKKMEVLIGDANGADKAMQKYLAEKEYKEVIVFCMGGNCRNNIGNWKIDVCKSDRIIKDFNYYEIKDRAMSDQADYGFMLWDGQSKGTLNNIINLLQRGKNVLVYFSINKNFLSLKNFSELENLLKECNPDNARRFYHTLRIRDRLAKAQKELKLA